MTDPPQVGENVVRDHQLCIHPDLTHEIVPPRPRDSSATFTARNASISDSDMDLRETPTNRTVQVNMNYRDDGDDIEKDLEFSSYYQINRYGRKVRRSEVLGFGFISLTVMSIALLAQLGMEALGFFSLTELNPVHPPHTFSWKLLTEYYSSNTISKVDKDCLFNKKGLLFQRDETEPSDLFISSVLALRSKVNQYLADEEGSVLGGLLGNETIERLQNHKEKCKYRLDDGWTWLSKYIYSMFFSFLNIVCSLIFLSCIRCRRKKCLQFGLLVPSFICFFMDIFQQIPLTFHFCYANMVLMEDMRNSLSLTVPPIIISPIWEHTQISGQCCGVQSYATWSVHGIDSYPHSCCDTTANPCPKDVFPTSDEVWPTGCYEKEFEKLRHFEGYALLLLFLKLVAEIGLFWSLSDLTRYDYPPPEHVRNSQCIVKNYEVITKGCVTTLGVTHSHKATMKLRSPPLKHHFGLNTTITGLTLNIRFLEKIYGSVEIKTQGANNPDEIPIVDYERGRKRGLIFVTF